MRGIVHFYLFCLWWPWQRYHLYLCSLLFSWPTSFFKHLPHFLFVYLLCFARTVLVYRSYRSYGLTLLSLPRL